MSAKPTRGARTRGLISGRLSEPMRAPKPERRARVAHAYCRRVELAVLAAIAFEMSESGEEADAAMLAYETARAAYTPRADMPPLASDMAGEAALGRAWAAGIIALTLRYGDNARIERKATAISDAQRWIANLGKAAAALETAYNATLDPLAKSIARADIEAQLPYGTELREIAEAARRIAWAAPIVVSAMDNEAGCKDGMAWDRWILGLTKFCRENGLPYRVTHDPELRSDERQSEFVELVAALMKEMPRRFRRHDGSYGALAHAVSKARNAAEKRRLDREEQEAHSAE